MEALNKTPKEEKNKVENAREDVQLQPEEKAESFADHPPVPPNRRYNNKRSNMNQLEDTEKPKTDTKPIPSGSRPRPM